MVFQSSKIASGFHDYYYAELYNLEAKLSPGAQAARLTDIQEYLSMTSLPHLMDDQRSDLKSPITDGEIESTVKSLPNGISSGHDRFTKAYYTTFTPSLLDPMCRYFNSLA